MEIIVTLKKISISLQRVAKQESATMCIKNITHMFQIHGKFLQRLKMDCGCNGHISYLLNFIHDCTI